MAKAPPTTITTMRPDDLVSNPRNPRMHDERQIDHLVASLTEFGQTKPVLARKANHMIIAGDGIWQAAIRAGLKELKVLLWDVPQAKADAFMLADNRLGDLSGDDDMRVANLLKNIEDVSHQALGFTDEEVVQLLKDIEDQTIKIREITTGTLEDRFWISLRGALEKQAVVLEQLKKLLEKHPEIEVEQGTINIGA